MNLLPTQWSDLSEVPARSYQGFRFGGVTLPWFRVHQMADNF